MSRQEATILGIPPDPAAVCRALAYAAEAHGGQLRKGTQVPYLSHLLSVAALTMEHGGTTIQCQAAALHDVVEDCGGQPRLDNVRATFGDEVAAIVHALSDAAPPAGEHKPPWRPRKEAYLQHLYELVADGHAAVLVSACDKLHNAEAIVADATDPDGEPGLAVFDRFSASPADTAWYYRGLRRALVEADLPGRLVDRFTAAVNRLDELARRADPENAGRALE